MISGLLRKLAGEADAPLTQDESRVAVAALLVLAAQADHTYEEVERAQIERVLAARYGLDAATAAALRAEGEEAERVSLDIYRFTSRVKKYIPYEERAAVVEAMWRVVLADGVREQHEEALMRRVADLVGLDPRESIEARRRVEGR
ncbi:MAG TPA: TerB family tellurite resistance protein [Candidatus Binatia bacterium]|nr:TerB family tellurite resistance protein [Candidatus Binatia bacterium]